MKHLWQRIFAYTLLLILISQAAVLLLHRYSLHTDEAHRFIAETVASIASAVDGQSLNTANAVTKLFSRRNTKTWVERENGDLIAGVRAQDPAMLEKVGDAARWRRDTIDIWETRKGAMYFLAATPVTVDGSPAVLTMAFNPPRRPIMWNIFLQGITALSFVGLMLALWMAWRVSRPLRALHGEVMDIAGGNLERRVSISGKDEIADVAIAVNHMADTLAKNIRSMKELVANISHEMRSPLARMQVSLALLEEDAPGKTAQGQIKRLHEELDHMNKLIGATLLSSKLDLQRQGPMTADVALSDLCAEMCRRQEPIFAKRGLTFQMDITPDITVTGEETLLSQLVSNLLDNAAKYAGENGAASLTLSRRTSGVVLHVENTHAPLPQDVLEHLFEPFYRGGIATGSGVGLGLSLVAKIAALHGGAAAVANTETGIRFTIRLPG